ncbi:hypothetical protein O0I10_006252 [Lichtheimia ornata]|uniref:F-box domain-containing protein n=1 Tax=Lichtheimia ornata TaxID=688661 RepID=A0AAD7XYX4_9FUNG|nr:uncharacterized protein O0I10_006252 [Lichtheimia ornata]KAJ8657981.1 hypothetical protein O0I10_006252 [Lichtheimia ornata]
MAQPTLSIFYCSSLTMPYSPILTPSSEKYAQLVYDATTQLHASLDPILSALNLRAIGFTKCAKFDAALRDVKLMQQLSSSSPLAYIREASIYSELGQQLDVIDICDEGLSMVDTNDTHYDTLQQMKADAEQHLEKRIDFVKELPVDIVITKLIPLLIPLLSSFPLDPLYPSPYLHVSNVWRDRIIQCFDGLWFKLDDIKEEPGQETLSEITQFAQHTRSLTVYHNDQGTWLGDLLRENDYCSLRKLSVVERIEEGSIEDFVSSLKSVSNTLTHFDIGAIYPPMRLSIPKVILTFPNLVSLRIKFKGHADLSALPIATWPKLTTFTIYRADKEITRDDIIGICKRFPSLTTLELHPCEDIEAVHLVSHYYPWMKYLRLAAHHMGINCEFTNQGYDNNKQHGITEFFVTEYCEEPGTLTTIDSFLNQHHTTLENMRWEIYHGSDVEHTHDIQYPRLKKLSLVQSGWWVPGNAPRLEELTISWIMINKCPQVLHIIQPNVKKLVLDLDREKGLEDPSILVNYLSRMNQQSAFCELDIRCIDVDNIESVLDAIPSLDHLQRLMLYFTTYFDWDQYDMEWFFDGLAEGCPRLACLEIQYSNAPSIDSIKALKQLEGFKQFNFSVENASDDDDFWKAIEELSQLECIRIYPGNEVNIDMIRYLKTQRPDLEVIVDARFTRF